jgi:hypothetical protein
MEAGFTDDQMADLAASSWASVEAKADAFLAANP